MSNGVGTNSIIETALADSVLVNRDGNTFRQPISRLAQQLSVDAVSVNKQTRANLYADLTWDAGARAAVWGDATEAYRGIYLKSGAAGAGAWDRIGDLPQTAMTTAQLAAKADRSQLITSVNLFDVATMVRSGYYWSPGSKKVVVGAGFKITKRIPVTPGETLFARYEFGAMVLAFTLADVDDPGGNYDEVTLSVGHGLLVVPTNRNYVQVTVGDGSSDRSADFLLARSSVPVAKTSYAEKLNKTMVEGDIPPSDLMAKSSNLFDSAMIMSGVIMDVAGCALNANARSSGFIKVKPGARYLLSGLDGTTGKGWGTSATPNASGAVTYGGAIISGRTKGYVTIPAGHNWLVFDLTRAGRNVTTFDATASVVRADVSDKAYTGGKGIDPKYLPDDTLYSANVLEDWAYNKIDPAKADFTRRYSTGSLGFVTDANPIAASDWIPVKAGQFYCFWGAAYSGWQGGYFSEYGAETAVANITFAAPPTGEGRIFQVPTGMGITHVVLSLSKTGSALTGPVQLEDGETATTYKAYASQKRVRSELLPESSGGGTTTPSVGFSQEAWYKFVESDGGGADLSNKLPKFREKWLLRAADLVVVNTGTSLTARSTEHCSDHPQASTRPPLMHSLNFASHIWDKLKWEGQQYRRYDAPGTFTETGTWATAHDLAEWDDGPYRHGLTRYSSTAGAAVSFAIPVGAYQFNFIYRTDSVGATCAVAIAGGNGLVQVLNDAGSWVEANGYSFSQTEAAPVSRNVNVPSPTTGSVTVVNMPSKGNTTYQKRLKMRCRSSGGGVDSRASAKTVTITRTGGGARMMFWGVEWSPREHMVTYINAARGSHNTGTSTTGLTRYQDNEVWGFKPDLMLFELPIHNDGAASATGAYGEGYWAGLTERFVFKTSFELSMLGSCTRLGLTAPEICMFTASIAWNFGGIGADGALLFGETNDTHHVMTALDRYAEAHNYVLKNQPTAVSIHAAQRWVDAGVAIHGNLKVATEGSGKAGNTFTNEGSHWNDTGSKIMAKVVLPVIPHVW